MIAIGIKSMAKAIVWDVGICADLCVLEFYLVMRRGEESCSGATPFASLIM